MKKSILLFVISPFVCINFIFAQGFLWDSISQQKFDQLEPLEIDSRVILPSKSSLEKFTPNAISQGNTPMCVAYALSNARTILYARNKKITSRSKIEKIRFSPFFMHFNLVEDCQIPLYPDQGLDFLEDDGIAKMSSVEGEKYYPKTRNSRRLCDSYPKNHKTDRKEALKFKIDFYNTVKTILQIKSSIYSGNPCLYGIYTPDSFHGVKTDLWKPSSREYPKRTGHHALVVIGYDDKKYGGSFRILNSWGADWGDDGKVWIKYKDFKDYMIAAFSIHTIYE